MLRRSPSFFFFFSGLGPSQFKPQRNAARTLRTKVSTDVVQPNSESIHRPTPLVLLPGPVTNSSLYSKYWSPYFAKNGYETITVELTVEEEEGKKIGSPGKEIIPSFVHDLASVIRQDCGFVIGHDFHALTAQKYAESHPSGGPVLINGFRPPPPQKRSGTPVGQKLLTSEFYDSIPPPVFEPTFPVLLLGSRKDRVDELAGRFAESLKEDGEDGWVSMEIFDDGDDKEGLIMTGRNWKASADRILEWMDEHGY